MAAAPEIVIVEATDRFRVGYCGSLVIGAWPGRAFPDDLDVFRRAELRALERSSVLNLIIALKLHSGGIEPRMREKGEALQREFADKLVGQAVVLAGTGLLAATVRAFTSGLNLLSRARVRTRTFGEPADALTWLTGLEGQSAADAEQLSALAPALAELTRDLYETPAE